MIVIKLNPNDKSTYLSLLDDYTVKSTSSSWGLVRATEGKSSGKWYYEVEMVDISGGNTTTLKRINLGVSTLSQPIETFNGSSVYGRAWQPSNRTLYKGGSTGNGSYGSYVNKGDVVSVLLDMDNGTLEFWINGVSQGIAYNDLSTLDTVYATESLAVDGATVKVNYGQTSFKYNMPEGFLSYTPKIKLLLKNHYNNQHYSLEEKTLITFSNALTKNMALYHVNEGVIIPPQFTNKNYILQDTVSENTDGLWVQELDRKPLSIKFE